MKGPLPRFESTRFAATIASGGNCIKLPAVRRSNLVSGAPISPPKIGRSGQTPASHWLVFQAFCVYTHCPHPHGPVKNSTADRGRTFYRLSFFNSRDPSRSDRPNAMLRCKRECLVIMPFGRNQSYQKFINRYQKIIKVAVDGFRIKGKEVFECIRA